MSELRVVFLGTSSGKPTPARNVSAVALVLDGVLVLFDCGEGTQLQFTRARVRASRLELACITHLHGDHVNGLPGFLASLGLNQHDRPVVVTGPNGLREYFRTLRRLGICAPRFDIELREVEGPGTIYLGDDFRIEAYALDHRIETWGYRFVENDKPGRFDLDAAKALGVPAGPLYGQLQRGQAVTLEDGRVIEPSAVLGPARRGRVVAYVTDTRPTPAAQELARGADLLIHEGTYGPEFTREAHQRGHSTVVDAARVAAAAGVGRLVITHISPKYHDIGPLLSAAREVFPKTIIARDFDEYVVEAIG